MHTGKVLFILAEDAEKLSATREPTYTELIDATTGKLDFDDLQTAAVIIFAPDSDTTHVLKNRYGQRGVLLPYPIHNGSTCPACKKETGRAIAREYLDDCCRAARKVSCLSCGATWTENLKVVGFENLQPRS